MPEIVYVLTNEAMPGYTKIGKTNNLEQRLRDLYRTPVPLPFECFYAAVVADASFVERQLHEAFGDHRVSPNREFFEIAPERVVAALKLATLEDVTPKKDYVETQADQQALNSARTRRGAFNFDMVKIAPGATLTFSRDPDITCTVATNRQVTFEGQAESLSSAALTVLHRMGYQWPTVNGLQFWQYRDEGLGRNELLTERRKRMEEEEQAAA
jgi:hypothetical protein